MADQYLHRLVELIERAGSTNDAALDEVAERFATTLADGGLVHLYGSGHSVLPCQEAFPRYGIVGVPILEAGSRFFAPVRYGDAVAVRTRVVWVREKTFRVEHELSVGDRRCAEGFEIRAWVARPEAPGARLRALRIPSEVTAKLGGGL